jgi:hypothetical protein
MDDRMTDTIAQAAEQAGAAIRTATTEFGRNARSRADDSLDDLAQQVARQPLSALLIAAGAGWDVPGAAVRQEECSFLKKRTKKLLLLGLGAWFWRLCRTP